MSSATSNKPAWTPSDEPTQKDLNLLNQRVIQFTDTEDTTLDVWLQLENADLDEEAAKFLNAGLLFEHYLSQLPNDPAQRSSEQVEQLETYRRDFDFFFSSRRRHTRCSRDWSSDVCSSDLARGPTAERRTPSSAAPSRR